LAIDVSWVFGTARWWLQSNATARLARLYDSICGNGKKVA
jgi:hypothetical protein